MSEPMHYKLMLLSSIIPLIKITENLPTPFRVIVCVFGSLTLVILLKVGPFIRIGLWVIGLCMSVFSEPSKFSVAYYILFFVGLFCFFRDILYLINEKSVFLENKSVFQKKADDIENSNAVDVLTTLVPTIAILLSLLVMFLPINFGTEKTVETEADSREQATQKPLENITVSISYTAKLTGNNSVGNDWSVSSYCEGNTIVRGKEQTITVPEIFTVECKAVESDNSPDIGYSDIIFSDLIIGFPETKTVTVYVRENRGRYSGNVATWSFTVTVERLS